MDLMRARITLRERPLLDVFDLAVRFCAVHAGVYARLAAAVTLPGFALSWGAERLGGWWLAWPVTVAATAFGTAPFVALASRLVFEDGVRAREALAMALRATPKLAAIRFVQLLGLGASLLMAGLPWLWLGTVLVFVVEVVVLEQSPLAATLGRTVRVAQAHLSSAGSTMFILLLGPACAAMLADVAGREILETILEIKPPETMFRAGGSVLALAGWWSVLPVLSTARFFAYLDIRTRTEGWDIQTRFAGIAARANGERTGMERRAA